MLCGNKVFKNYTGLTFPPTPTARKRWFCNVTNDVIFIGKKKERNLRQTTNSTKSMILGWKSLSEQSSLCHHDLFAFFELQDKKT